MRSKAIGSTTTNILIGVLIVGAVLAGGLALWWNNRTGSNITGISQDYEEVMDDLRTIPDPSLILYSESVSPIALGFSVPRAIAVGPVGIVYVSGDQAIRRFDRNGEPAGDDIPLGEAGYCLAVAEEGTIFVGMKNHVEVYDPDGKAITRWEVLRTESRLTSIAVTDEDVFVAIYSNRFGIVHRYDRAGEFLNSIQQEKPDTQRVPFNVPSPYFDIAVGAGEMVHIAHTGEQQVERYTFRGHWGGAWGGGSHMLEGFFGCCNPVHIALLPNDKGYITCEKGINRVKEYDLDGTFVGVVAAPDDFSKGQRVELGSDSGSQFAALEVAIDSQGRVLILDPFTCQVRIYERKEK